MKIKLGFNFAEVLLTLSIIGIVAALTMPAVHGHFERKIVGVRLHKFYSLMNQALAQYYKDNNMIPQDFLCPTAESTSGAKTWWDSTIGPQFPETREYTPTNHSDRNKKYCVLMKDETAFCVKKDGNNTNIHFYTDTKYSNIAPYDGIHGYLFVIEKGKLYTSVPNIGNTLTTRAALLNSCRKCDYQSSGNSNLGKCHACSRLIQQDGWNLKNDYPWKKECTGSGCS